MNWFGKEAAKPAEATKDFVLPWPAVWPEKFEGKEPALLLTDALLSPVAVADILNSLASPRANRPLVFIVPHIADTARELLGREKCFWIQAQKLPGQPLSELLTDISWFCEAEVLSAEHGWGMKPPVERKGPIVMPGIPWKGIHWPATGKATLLRATADGMWLQAGDSLLPRRIERALAALQPELDVTGDAQLRSGLEQRIRRFGGVAKSGAPTLSEPTDAMSISTRLASRYFITDPALLESVLTSPRVLLFSFPLTDFEPLIPALEHFATNNLSFLVVAPGISGAALAGLVVNKLRGIIQCAAAIPQGEATNVLAQLSAVTRAQVLGPGTLSAERPLDPVVSGSAPEVRVGLSRCVIRKRAA